jgi:hypothetical protein
MEDRSINQVLSGVGTTGSGEDIRKGCRRVNLKSGGNVMYSCMKMET